MKLALIILLGAVRGAIPENCFKNLGPYGQKIGVTSQTDLGILLSASFKETMTMNSLASCVSVGTKSSIVGLQIKLADSNGKAYPLTTLGTSTNMQCSVTNLDPGEYITSLEVQYNSATF